MAKALIIGMGFGQAVYKPVLEQAGYEVITVDMDATKGADFTDVDEAIRVHGKFDTVNICTPNFTHIKLARKVAVHSGIVFVEKPGVATKDAWQQLVTDYPNTRFMMVKNNQYRPDMKYFKSLADQSNEINVIWNNKNRIPNPGSWFTNKSLAFGGVSRDLIPHMLSYYCALTKYSEGSIISATAEQRHQLADITDTDYGVVNYDGVYDVDDYCKLVFKAGKTTWNLIADWKNDLADDVYISFGMNNSAVKVALGLCPAEAYGAMIAHAVSNIDNDAFWQEQLSQDLWIHQQIENL